MRILTVSKFWYRRGGLERVMLDEVRWLEEAGHTVAHFASAHPANDPSPWQDRFAPYIELGEEAETGRADQAKAALRLFYNREAQRRFAGLLADFRPDVVHAHGIHRQLSPSILRAARRARVPVVQTLHDYHPICPADVLLRGTEVVCEPPLCTPRNTLPCVTYRCVRLSRGASALSAAELWWRRWVMRYDTLVDRFVSPSEFLKTQIERGAWRTPVRVVPNAVPVTAGTSATNGSETAAAESTAGGARTPTTAAGGAPYFLYAGRVSREKGIETAVEAATRAKVRLLVAGEGPAAASLVSCEWPGCEPLGRLPGDEVDELLRGCRAAVLPARWYENAPMAVLEAMAAGVPIIASRIGGIPELVRDGEEGLLVPPGEPEPLAEAFQKLAGDAALAREMGERGVARVRERFSPESHVLKLLAVFDEALRA